MTVTKGIRRGGERGVSRKTIAQGMSECSPLTCMLVCANVHFFGTRDRGCSAHPAFPAPSLFGGRNNFKKLGQNVPRACKTASSGIDRSRCNSFHGGAELGRQERVTPCKIQERPHWKSSRTSGLQPAVIP